MYTELVLHDCQVRINLTYEGSLIFVLHKCVNLHIYILFRQEFSLFAMSSKLGIFTCNDHKISGRYLR